MLSVKSKNIKDNYKESYYIFMLMMVKLPFWIAWVTCTLSLPETYKNASQGFGIVGSCVLTFLVMFLPTSRQQTVLGKDVLYSNDPDDSNYHQQRPYHKHKQTR